MQNTTCNNETSGVLYQNVFTCMHVTDRITGTFDTARAYYNTVVSTAIFSLAVAR
jgi:hypothetical protein